MGIACVATGTVRHGGEDGDKRRGEVFYGVAVTCTRQHTWKTLQSDSGTRGCAAHMQAVVNQFQTQGAFLLGGLLFDMWTHPYSKYRCDTGMPVLGGGYFLHTNIRYTFGFFRSLRLLLIKFLGFVFVRTRLAFTQKSNAISRTLLEKIHAP